MERDPFNARYEPYSPTERRKGVTPRQETMEQSPAAIVLQPEVLFDPARNIAHKEWLAKALKDVRASSGFSGILTLTVGGGLMMIPIALSVLQASNGHRVETSRLLGICLGMALGFAAGNLFSAGGRELMKADAKKKMGFKSE